MRVLLRRRQLAVLLCLACMAEIAVGVEFGKDSRQFTFAWPYEDQVEMGRAEGRQMDQRYLWIKSRAQHGVHCKSLAYQS